MTSLHIASAIRTGAIHKALRQINPEVCHKRQAAIKQETGESVPRLIERTAGMSIAEACRQSGMAPATVRKLRERWL